MASGMRMHTAEALEISETERGEERYLRPEKSSQEPGIVLLLFMGSCLYLKFFYNYTTLHSDEGIVLEGAQRILRGQVPYRDFFSFYTPGSYYWTVLLFKIFGNSILVPRTALVVYGGVFSALTYLLARRVCSRASSLLATGLALVRSEEHTSELQSHSDLVCRLLLE